MNQQSVREHANTIKAALSEGRLQDAETRVDQALAETQASLALHLLKARVLQGTGDLPAARALCEHLCSAFPDSPQPEKRLAALSLAEGDPALAARHASAAGRKGLDPDELYRLQARIAAARGDLSAQAQWLERIAARETPPNAGLLLQLADLHSQRGDAAAEREALDRALAVDEASPRILQRLACAAMAQGDPDRAERAAAGLRGLPSDKPAWIAEQCFLLSGMGHADAAHALMRTAIGRGLGGFRLFSKLNAAALPEDLLQHVVRWAESVAADAPAAERAKAVEVLAEQGRPIASGLLAGARRPDGTPGPLSRFDWLGHAPADAVLQRPALSRNSGDEVIVAPAAQTGVMALVFTGLADRAMVPLPSLDRYLAALGLSAAYLRDFNRLLFLRGIASTAPDFEGTVGWLRQLLEASGARRIVTIGTSAGGYAAIRYGMLLGADRILTFSPATNLRADFDPEERRARLVARKVQALPQELLDIKPFVVAHGGRTPIHVAYGGGMGLDVRQALHLQDAPGVQLHPLDGLDAHDSLVWMARQGRLLSFLRRTLL